MSEYVAIRSAINTKLLTLTGTGQKLAGVYQSFEEKSTGYPCVMFEPTNYDSKMHSTTDNLRKYEFTLLFMTEFEKKNRKEALDILLPAIDDAIKVLENDYTLGGTVDLCNNTIGEMIVENSPSGAIIYLEMKLNCTKEVSTTT